MDEQLEQTIFSDLAQMEETLIKDFSGDRARSLIKYFSDVAAASEQMSVGAPSEAERHLATKLVDGFRASQRIIRHVWESLHNTALTA
jgi:hypothetical protein